ncbi:hypothetical protein [Emticicia sp. BO119]|uniref:hypothetical protein n=1 Tax=Emticicia sp. BO119 TaxID=2757768 RepID=UPI0015F0270F|nr:hypothetical protein [Emticicia sp. BO119]MBA4852723.1 hypothetical protein [Emticicia sp. BO119]
MINNERFYIEKCKELLEAQLAWGDSANWQNQDFEELSELIFAKTKVSLSNSTLKRIWGKVKYDSSPNLATLNVLAQFIGFENWREFMKSGVVGRVEEPAIAYKPEPDLPTQYTPKKFNWGLVATVIILFTGALWAFQKKSDRLTYSNVSFTSTPVAKGLPNTVIFQYNAADSNADSVFIQQSWDPSKRYKVDKNKHEYTSTYYTPGYFQAKLILNNTIVKEHDLFIESDGWLGMIDKEPVPAYLFRHEIDKIDRNTPIEIDEKGFKNLGIDLNKEKLWSSIHKVSRKNTVSSEHFLMETEVKNTFSRGEGVCQYTRILLLGTEGVIIIPLSIKGCVGELQLNIHEKIVDGRTNDLSSFGVDFKDFIKVKCEVQNQKIRIWISDKLAYQGGFVSPVGKIVGTRIRFSGTGVVRAFNINEI